MKISVQSLKKGISVGAHAPNALKLAVITKIYSATKHLFSLRESFMSKHHPEVAKEGSCIAVFM